MAEELRQIVKVVDVDEIEPIEGADLIHAVRVGYWRVVTKKTEIQHAGERALFFEIDACLPMADPRFAHLAARGVRSYEGAEYHRLKSAKLRGVVSQGFLLPAEQFPELDYDGDLAEQLGVLKYDELNPPKYGGGVPRGNFPTHLVQKTDSERIQNIANRYWDIIQQHQWIATEKIDGTSCTIIRHQDELIVCSRNQMLTAPSADNYFGEDVYWGTINKYQEIIDALPEGYAVQCEIYGPGIQKNPLDQKERKIAIFSYSYGFEQLPRHIWPSALAKHAAPVYDLELPVTQDEAIAQVNGIKSLINPKRLAEGVVWTQTEGHKFSFLGDRATWKAISNKYLLKSDE